MGRVAAVLAAIAVLAAACSGGGDSQPRDRGELLYLVHCAACHANDGSGATGPAIADGVANDRFTVGEMIGQIISGVGEMPSFSDQLAAEEIADIVDFVRTRLVSAGASPPSGTSPEGQWVSGLGVPPEAVEFADDWPLPNRDHASSRWVRDSPIDSTTVDRLEMAWRSDVPGGSAFGNLATTPLIVDRRIFLEDLSGVVHAIDRQSGDSLWTSGPPGALFGPTGVAVGWGKVFGTKVGPRGRGESVVAYDIDTGDELWAVDVTPGFAEINVQPFVYDGLVFISTSGFPAGVRGTVFALDHATGAVVWSFATVESEDLWGNPQINSGGGAWYPPALDVAGGRLFFGVGNPYPFPGAPGFPAGSSRPGYNRWTSGTVALDVTTGLLDWGFQAFPHDIFDRDHVLTALADVEIDGAEQTILITAGKGGVVIALDPSTGSRLWSTPVGRHQNDDVTGFDGPLEVLPGAQGSVVTPIAVADGVVYLAAINAPTVYADAEANSGGEGTELFTMPSNVIAIDASNGSILWDVEVADDVLGGATVVSDLVFTSTITGMILAMDRDTGEVVWRRQADGGINGWPAVAGDLMVFPVGFADPPHLMALRLEP